MTDTFFEHYDTPAQQCNHENNDGLACFDCCELLTNFTNLSFGETKNYLPRRVSGNTIKLEDINTLCVPSAVLHWAREMFEIITHNKIYRGNSRLGSIAACLLHSYKFHNLYISPDEVINALHIKPKKCLTGFQKIDLVLWERDRDRYNQLSVNNLTFEQAAATLAGKLGIQNIEHIDFNNWSKTIRKGCRITTAAAVAVWLFITQNNMPITIQEVATHANLSVNTIKKVAL